MPKVIDKKKFKRIYSGERILRQIGNKVYEFPAIEINKPENIDPMEIKPNRLRKKRQWSIWT